MNPQQIITRRALLIPGDLIDGHPEPEGLQEQWTTFDKLFPARPPLTPACPP